MGGTVAVEATPGEGVDPPSPIPPPTFKEGEGKGESDRVRDTVEDTVEKGERVEEEEGQVVGEPPPPVQRMQRRRQRG